MVVQARRTWWLAAPRSFSPAARRANPKNVQYHTPRDGSLPTSAGSRSLRIFSLIFDLFPAKTEQKSCRCRPDPWIGENLSGEICF